MEISIADFHKSFYIPEIQKLAFHLTHVRILVLYGPVRAKYPGDTFIPL